jgi:hypothetical protein
MRRMVIDRVERVIIEGDYYVVSAVKEEGT